MLKMTLSKECTAAALLFGLLLHRSPDRDVKHFADTEVGLRRTLQICDRIDSVGHFPALVCGDRLLGLEVTFVAD